MIEGKDLVQLDRLANSWISKGRSLCAHGDWPTGEAYKECAKQLRLIIYPEKD